VGGGAGEGGDGEVSEGKQVWMFDTAVFCVSLKTNEMKKRQKTLLFFIIIGLGKHSKSAQGPRS
jgi:hypothetical protein